MQEKKDYLMMQIEQLGRVLGKILADLLGLKPGNISGCYEMAKESLKTDLDVDIELLILMSKSDFQDYVSTSLFKSSNLYNQLALILIEAAGGQFDKERSLKLFEKALWLYKMEIKESKTFSFSNQKRISELESIIEDLKKND